MLAEAQARARSNGLALEQFDGDYGDVWPNRRFVGVRLMKGREVVAWMLQSYHDDASKRRAMQICAKRVFNAPTRADHRPVAQGRGA